MIKTAIIGTAAVVALGLALFGTGLFTYMKMGFSEARQTARDSIPPHVRLKEAQHAVEKLVPAIRNSMHVIAEQQVEVEHLRNQITQREQEIDRQKEQLLALKTDLERGEKQYVYAGETYTADDVRRDLHSRFGRFKVAADSLKRDKEILEAREQTLKVNEGLLEEMLSKKQELEIDLARLEERVKMERAKAAASTLAIDDSELARAKRLIDDLNRQLDVKDKVRAAEGKLMHGIPVDARAPAPQNIGAEIDEYFGNDTPEKREL